MNIIGPSVPISLDALNRQLHSIGLKLNKACSSSSSSATNYSSSNSSASNTTTSTLDAFASFEHNIRGGAGAGVVDQLKVAAVQEALQESDALISQVRKACEDFSDEPIVLQLEAAVWIQRARIEHVAGRFRQASSAYENATRLLLQVESRRACVFPATQDALNQAVSCALYACGELILAEQVCPSVGLTSLTNSSGVAAIASTAFASTSGSGQAHPGFFFGSMQDQRLNFGVFPSNFSNNTSDSDSTNNLNTVSSSNNNNSNSNTNNNSASTEKSIGSRISSWFKGLPSIQPANSPAGAVAAEEQEAIRKQREAEKAAKRRREAVWRLLPLDAPHRCNGVTQRVCSILRFMTRELLRFDCVDLAAHFAELSARYCLDYKFSFSFYSDLYQATAMKRKLEIVAPSAPAAPSPVPRGFVAIPVSLCRLIEENNNNNATESSNSSSSSSFYSSPVVEFCSVSTLQPTVRQQFTESMLQLCSISLLLRQFERARISGTFALFCLENNRHERFSYSVPKDHVNNNSNNNQSDSQSFPTSHFVTVATMNSNFMDETKNDENCALIGLTIVLGVICSRPFPNFKNTAESHILWWEKTFVEMMNDENDDEEEEEEDPNSPNHSEFFIWRKPVTQLLKQFIAAVENLRDHANDEDGDDSELFSVVENLRRIIFERNQMIAMCIHRMYHEIFSIQAENSIAATALKCVVADKLQNKSDDKNLNQEENERAPSPKLGDRR
jgi:hypothetical protein